MMMGWLEIAMVMLALEEEVETASCLESRLTNENLSPARRCFVDHVNVYLKALATRNIAGDFEECVGIGAGNRLTNDRIGVHRLYVHA